MTLFSKIRFISYIALQYRFALIVLKWSLNLRLLKILQVNLCQKLSFLHLLTHNMTTDCSLNYKKYKFSTCCVHKLFWMSKKKQRNNLCTQHVLNLNFSCNSMNSLLSYNESIDARIRASKKDLPVKAS